jgi:hypothetical protein
MIEVFNILVQVFAVFGVAVMAAEFIKHQKRNDDQLRPIPIRVQAQRRNRRK